MGRRGEGRGRGRIGRRETLVRKVKVEKIDRRKGWREGDMPLRKVRWKNK